MAMPQNISYGYCHCGCGELTNLAPQTQKSKGWVKDEPKRYVMGHRARLHKIPDEDIVSSYEEHGSVWRAAEVLGCSGQLVHQRLKKLGVDTSANVFTAEELQLIREFYEAATDTPQDSMGLGELAERMGRLRSSISYQARAMGLTRRDRPQSAVRMADMTRALQEHIAANGHPRGALGLQHSEETRGILSQRSRAYWERVTPQELEERRVKALTTRRENGTSWTPGPGGGGYQHCKRGVREDLGFFVRSSWEANWARYLKFLIDNQGDPLERFEYEPDTFWFDGIKRGCVSYTPDFKLYERGKEPYFHEVKGRMDQKSRTKLKRMKQYHPGVRVEVIDEKAYREVERKLGAAIPGWEFPGS